MKIAFSYGCTALVVCYSSTMTSMYSKLRMNVSTTYIQLLESAEEFFIDVTCCTLLYIIESS